MIEEFTQIDYRRWGSVGRLTLGRPGRSLLSPTMVRELHQALDLIDRDEELGFLVVSGTGRGLCAGLDPDYARRTVALECGFSRLVEEVLEPFVDFVVRLSGAAEHVIAAVNGPCSAAGLWVVRACGHVVAAESASALAEQEQELIDGLADVSGPAHRARPRAPSEERSPHPDAAR